MITCCLFINKWLSLCRNGWAFPFGVLTIREDFPGKSLHSDLSLAGQMTLLWKSPLLRISKNSNLWALVVDWVDLSGDTGWDSTVKNGGWCGFAKGLLLFPRSCASCATWRFYFSHGSHGWLFVLPSLVDDVKGNNHSMLQCGSITIPCNMYVPSASFPSFFQPLLEFKVRHTATCCQLNGGSLASPQTFGLDTPERVPNGWESVEFGNPRRKRPPLGRYPLKCHGEVAT